MQPVDTQARESNDRFIHPGSLIAIAAVEREIAEMEAADAAVAAGLARRHSRRLDGPSVVYSIRLDSGEVAALERRAAALGVKPTVLARNLIRSGLQPGAAEAAG